MEQLVLHMGSRRHRQGLKAAMPQHRSPCLFAYNKNKTEVQEVKWLALGHIAGRVRELILVGSMENNNVVDQEGAHLPGN